MQRVLFLCTGNYYRSRFAEHLFNQLAAREGLGWRADSCGLRVRPDGVVNHGPLSPFARQRMLYRQIPFDDPCRFPRQVSADDLTAAALIIALKEAEHRTLMEALHPSHAAHVRYWHIHDRDVATPEMALADLETHVNNLVQELSH